MEITDKASKLVHEAGDKIVSATNFATDGLSEQGEKIKNAEQQLLKNCRGYIHDNPLTSMGIAIASGFFLSRLLTGR